MLSVPVADKVKSSGRAIPPKKDATDAISCFAPVILFGSLLVHLKLHDPLAWSAFASVFPHSLQGRGSLLQRWLGSATQLPDQISYPMLSCTSVRISNGIFQCAA